MEEIITIIIEREFLINLIWILVIVFLGIISTKIINLIIKLRDYERRALIRKKYKPYYDKWQELQNKRKWGEANKYYKKHEREIQKISYY